MKSCLAFLIELAHQSLRANAKNWPFLRVRHVNRISDVSRSIRMGTLGLRAGLVCERIGRYSNGLSLWRGEYDVASQDVRCRAV